MLSILEVTEKSVVHYTGEYPYVFFPFDQG